MKFRTRSFLFGAVAVAGIAAGAFSLWRAQADAEIPGESSDRKIPADDAPLAPLEFPAEPRVLYITASIANHARMDDIIRLMKDAEGPYAPNALVIDIQDDSGKVLIDDRMKALVRRLRFLHIFPIARLVVFQNDSLAEEKPQWAVKTGSGSLWRDRGGRKWLDPENPALWDHVAGISRQAIDAGFGEINFDYFRFPSEGITTAVYPYWRGSSTGSGQEAREKKDVIADSARYLRDAIKADNADIKITADIFGYTFMRTYDLGIGQSAPALAAIFDAVCPMIYPSHYDKGNFNFENPAAHPYEVMKLTLEKGKEVFAAAGQPFTNIRPWVQDFDMGAKYTPQMVQDQMRAITDAGLSAGWLVWNPRNAYRSAIFTANE